MTLSALPVMPRLFSSCAVQSAPFFLFIDVSLFCEEPHAMISRFLLPYDSFRHELKEAIPNGWNGQSHELGKFPSARMTARAEISENLPVCFVHFFFPGGSRR